MSTVAPQAATVIGRHCAGQPQRLAARRPVLGQAVVRDAGRTGGTAGDQA